MSKGAVKKTNDLVARIVAAVCGIACLLSLWAIYEQRIQGEAALHAHLMPSVKCILDFPAAGNPVAVFLNNGALPVASFSVSHNAYRFDKSSATISLASKSKDFLLEHFVYRPALQPSEHADRELMRFEAPAGSIAVYDFHLKFYRPADMREAEQRCTFFVDDGISYSRQQYSTNPFLPLIVSQIDHFSFLRADNFSNQTGSIFNSLIAPTVSPEKRTVPIEFVAPRSGKGVSSKRASLPAKTRHRSTPAKIVSRRPAPVRPATKRADESLLSLLWGE